MSSSITRRVFVGAVTAGLAATHVKVTHAAPSDRLRLGCIGCGSRGTGDLAEFLRNEDVECVAVCDVDRSHAERAAINVEKQRGNKPGVETDFRRVIDRDDIDALLVATPDHWHALPTILACQSGKDVYVEKPFARTIDEGRAILEASKEHARIVQMGTQWRSGPHYAEAAAYVQSGKLGAIRMVRGWSYKTWDIAPLPDGPVPDGVDYDLWIGPAPKRPFNPNCFHRNFRWYWDYAGGLMTDLGVHVINFCQWATGLETPTRVSSMGSLPVLGDCIETPDTQTTIYQFPSYTFVWEHQLQGKLGPHNGESGAWISGVNGAVLVSGAGWEVIPDPAANGAIEAEKHLPTSDGRAEHVRNFLDCVKTREQPVSNPAVAHHVTTIAHLGNIAYRTGHELEWDAENERIPNSAEADALVSEPYRKPWTLPYSRRG